MTVTIRKIFVFLVLTIPLFLSAQEIDSAMVYGTNYKARNLGRDGNFTKALDLIQSLIKKIPQHELKYISYSNQTKAGLEQSLGLYEESIKTAKLALAYSKKVRDTFNISYNYNLIGIGYYFLSKYDSTKVYYEKSFKLKKKINADNKSLAVSAYNLAILYEDLAQTDKALTFYKEAEYYLLKENDPRSFLSDVYVGIAHLYFFGKDVNKAEEYSEKAMDFGLKSYGEFNPNMTFVYNSYANILVSKKKYAEAISLLEKSLKIRENSYGKYHKWTCESNYKLAEVFVLDKQYDKAEIYFKKAIIIGEKIKSLQYLANAKSYLARMYIVQKKNLDEANNLLLSALEKNIHVFGYQNNIIAENYYSLAEVARLTSNKELFFEFLSKVLNSSNYDKNHIKKVIAPYNTLDALVLKGDWYMDEYDKTQKIEYIEKSFDLIDEQIALIKYSQKNFSSDKSKIYFANENRGVFEKGLKDNYY